MTPGGICKRLYSKEYHNVLLPNPAILKNVCPESLKHEITTNRYQEDGQKLWQANEMFVDSGGNI
jgi:hypothetical protein